MRAIKRWLDARTSSNASDAARDASVEMSEANGVRSLHLGGDAIQSSIRLDNPDTLELHYTRALVAFLLFEPAPRDLLMIGLGGGSIARFVHRHLDTTRMTAVEVNPRVVMVARQYFGLPDDDERLGVVLADGADYVPARPLSTDVLLLDAFEDGAAVGALCTQRYYDACYAALRPGGIFAQNFMVDDPRLKTYIRRLDEAFNSRVLLLPAADKVNMILMAFKRDVHRFPIDDLKRAAGRLQRRLGLPFNQMVRDLVACNAHTARFLKFGPVERSE